MDKDQKLRDKGKVYAAEKTRATFQDSKIMDKSRNFPHFDPQEVTLGKILGKGGFGTVFEIRGFEAETKKKSAQETRKGLKQQQQQQNVHQLEDVVLPGQMESRKFIADHCIRQGGDARYALKRLSPNVVKDVPTFLQGIIDMATETRVLSDVEHPNIIRLRACAKVSPFEEDYFIVMDRLYDTLECRMEKWKRLGKRLKGIFGKGILDRDGTKKKDILEDKLVAAFDLSAALGYLHSRNILYRDLKPENIGFDIHDDVKVFDFGLAKEITPQFTRDDKGLYQLTSMTGSPRYMAPEVANDQPYNSTCDIYSFGIMFWQMYSDTVPFELYGMKSLKSRVWNGEQKRPYVQDIWPVPIKTLMRRSWSVSPQERPNFDQIYKILKNECVRIRGGNADGLEHTRRRSTFVFRGGKGKRLSTASKRASHSSRDGKSVQHGLSNMSQDFSASGAAIQDRPTLIVVAAA